MTAVQQRTLYQWFEETAGRLPDHPALEVGDEVLSYAELRALALTVAERIVHKHGRTPRRVALAASRTVAAYAGYLAVQRLGAGVVPLNSDHPVQRNLDVAQRAGVEVALVDGRSAGLFRQLPERHRPTVLELAEDERADAPPPAGALPPAAHDLDGEAYILFTSGSTGQPKGVPILQRQISPYLAHNIPRYEIAPGSRLSQAFGLTFDAHVFDLFATWGGGGTLVVPTATDLYTPVDFVVERRLTHWFSVPSVVREAQRLGNLPLGRAVSLRHSMFGAEPVTAQHAALWREVAPQSQIHNVYGPTELAICCTNHRLTGPGSDWPEYPGGTVPIGTMYPHMEGVLLDDEGLPADEGELCVRGPQRFDGYLDPRENTGRFLSYEEGGRAVVYDGSAPLTAGHWYRTGDRVRRVDGVMVHCGRLDQQVKVRGHRVETGEVEAVLRRHPHVVDAAVVALPADDGETELAAAYAGRAADPAALDAWLRDQMPLHMVPARIRRLDGLPLNDNGKTDRTALARILGTREGS
ncbi:AMP-binding protein [Streptomyces sp. MUM 178J]|uniref:AMP-binding protein n=1 Tax=Streptomyces sp. MUM 178J TaxID=2791991 RepID=UPI001F039520|nr:AMP-binding protein [Streptomyces sp. MUM 178J]WRQ80364.1 AMP-binding protein [Streptomyces sp. MUM 178J]